ncbi:MAG: hypothetical protein RCG15_02180 [Candidatus Rickettsia vulgarisii]
MKHMGGADGIDRNDLEKCNLQQLQNLLDNKITNRQHREVLEKEQQLKEIVKDKGLQESLKKCINNLLVINQILILPLKHNVIKVILINNLGKYNKNSENIKKSC